MTEYTYRLVTSDDPTLAYAAYEQLKDDDSLKFYDYEFGKALSPERFVAHNVSRYSVFLAGFVNGAYAGFMTLRPISPVSRCALIGVAGFRRWYKQAIPLSQGAFAFCYANLNVDSMIAHVVRTNYHITRLCRACGFAKLAEAPGMYFDYETDKYTSGYILLSTPQLLRAAMEV